MEPNEITAQIVDATFKIHTQLGLVLNFSLERMRDGITRIVNGLPEPPRPSEKIERGFSRRVAEDAEKSKTV
jgi:hypothetical protein